MRPMLFEIFGIQFPAYFTMLTVGFMVTIYLAWRDADRVGLSRDDVLDLSLYMLIGGLMGARLLHVFADGYFWDYVHLCTDPLQVDVPSFMHVPCAVDAECVQASAGALCNPETNRCHPAQDCFAALKFWQGGLAFYGGLALDLVIALWFLRKRGVRFLRMADMAGWGLAIGVGFGRLGCFLSGCCYGAVTESGLGVMFKGYLTRVRAGDTCLPGYDLITTETGERFCGFGRPAFIDHAQHGLLEMGSKHSLPVHATQLYELAFCWAIFAYLYFWRRKHSRFVGQVFWEYALLYGVGRFIVEYWRADARGLWLGELFSTSQLIALPFIIGGAFFIWRGHKKANAEAANGTASAETDAP